MIIQKDCTLIPLWVAEQPSAQSVRDGLYKQAENIIVGDKLIGDDGTLRTVKKIIKGTGQMYEITQSYGDNYTVNSEHILTLHMPDHKVIFWNSFKNGWTVLWWNNEAKSIKSKTMHIAQTKITCDECGIDLSSNLKRHYNRVHKDKEGKKISSY